MIKNIPLNYSFRNLFVRKTTTVFTILGLALVVFVFCTIVMLNRGLEKTVVATGENDNLIVTRRGSGTEVQSSITKSQAAIVSQLTGIMGFPEPKVSYETVILINLKKKTGTTSNVVIRGLQSAGIDLRKNIEIVKGRYFKEGSNEIIIGRAIAQRFSGLEIGQSINFGGEVWRIVGFFKTNNNGFESEMWVSNDVLMQAFQRQTYSTILFQLQNISYAKDISNQIEKDVRLPLSGKFERQFYEESSIALSNFISILGTTLTIIFSIGATIGAMITMQAAVMNRKSEIATLRALGFLKYQILFAFLFEALILSLFAGLFGLFLASLFTNVEFSTSNFQSFSELAFRFSFDSYVVFIGMGLSITMGVAGGLIPSIYATKIKITDALRPL
mgnify:FL=1|tara:strand:- start:3537 stop:4700 length:1164 start_codon:yes stop_codon:yes gene_type:complete